MWYEKYFVIFVIIEEDFTLYKKKNTQTMKNTSEQQLLKKYVQLIIENSKIDRNIGKIIRKTSDKDVEYDEKDFEKDTNLLDKSERIYNKNIDTLNNLVDKLYFLEVEFVSVDCCLN